MNMKDVHIDGRQGDATIGIDEEKRHICILFDNSSEQVEIDFDTDAAEYLIEVLQRFKTYVK